LAAFRETAAEHGMDVVVTMAGDWDGHLSWDEQELLTKPLDQRPTVAVCWADTYAYALLEDCRRLGLRVPEDLAVVGFDGIKTRITPAQVLTTVRAPWAAVAEKTIDILMEVIEGQAVEHEIVFPVELVVGDTA
jgi:LacI family transcriptional regulator